jgi:hypothetical protein
VPDTDLCERIAIKETREFGERRNAKVNRLNDEIHANRGEVTCAGLNSRPE